MATLTIPDSTYQRLAEMADARKLLLPQFLEQIAVAAFGDSPRAVRPGTPEWMAAFDAWVGSHPKRASFADDSRDVIYHDDRD